MAVIVKDGLKRMYVDGEDIFYYITVMNEKYTMPAMPSKKGIEQGILNGMYKYKSTRKNEYNINLLGSGTILNESLKAAEILKSDYNIYSDVWSVTSYKNLYNDAIETERQNRVSTGNSKNLIQKSVGEEKGIFVASTDYQKALPLTVAKWFPGTFTALGTDGYGLSDHRKELRMHFEVNAEHIVWSVLTCLSEQKKLKKNILTKAKKKLGIEANIKYQPYG
jgi:pyruvate dehydrogenase E1 component